MLTDNPTVLALDFDGVLCDGMKEYFQTSWRAYCNLWQVDDRTPPAGLAEQFYRTRPVILTGWEMPVLLRALLMGVTEADIFQNWAAISANIVAQDHLKAEQLSAEVDGIRDRWIATDLEGWLAEQSFYPGVAERLRSWITSPTQPVIISTKEGRFIQQLLQKQGVDPTSLRVIGKESKRPKHQILRELIQEYGTPIIWFVEDRLDSLHNVCKQPDLQAVKLFLADWGYNTASERESVDRDLTIQRLTINQFCQDFSAWVK